MSKNEKMMILEMLEKGQITADEAARLLEAAGGGGKPQSGKRAQSAPTSPPPPVPSSSYTPPSQNQNQYQYHTPTPTPASSASPRTPASGAYRPADGGQRSNNPSSSPRGGMSSPGAGGGSFSDELSRKFDTFVKDMEPKVHRFTEAVVEKTAQAADKISRTLTTPPSELRTAQSTSYSAPPPRTAPVSGMYESSVELKVVSTDSELNISGLNGQVIVKGYNGDKITARLFTRPKRAGAPIELMTLGNKYFLNYDENDFHQVAIDMYVPESMFYVIKLASVGGIVNVSTMKATHTIIENANGDIELNQLSAESLKVDCQNGNLRMSALSAVSGSIEGFNGSINATGLDISKLSLSTFNGALNLNMAGFSAFNDYTWSVESSNGKMNLFLPSSANVGYHMKAHASLGDIKIGLTGISYLVNEKSFAEAKSFNFDSAQRQVRLILETSNAPLIVN